MEPLKITKEDKKQLKLLKIKQYQSPDLMSKEDLILIQKLEAIKYASHIQPLHTPSSAQITPLSTGSSLGDSDASAYALLVGDHKYFKGKFSVLKLSHYDKEMEINHQHFLQAAEYRAPFVVFIRYFLVFIFAEF
jgi:hypothetical protein